MKFTLLVLQRQQGEKAASAANVVAGFVSASAAATPYGVVASQAVGVIREILRNQPDVVAFDFEATFLSDAPESLTPIVQVGKSEQDKRIESALASNRTASEAPNAAALVPALQRIASDLRAIDRSTTASDLAREVEKGLDRIAASARQAEAARALAFRAGDEPNAKQPELPVGLASWESHDAEQWRARIADYLSDARASLPKAASTPDDKAAASSAAALEAAAQSERRAIVGKVESGLRQLQKEELRLDNEARRLATSGTGPLRTSAWNAAWPWLQYGVFAIVQTDYRAPVDELREGANAWRLLPLNWNQRFQFDGGWIREKHESLTPNQWGGFRGNYLVFAITPGQISQHDSVLMAADAANRQLLEELRANPDGARQMIATLHSFGQNLTETIIRKRADAIGREVAARSQSASDPLTDFQSNFSIRWNHYVKSLMHVEGAPRAEALEHIGAEARFKWESRLSQLKRGT
ncbi:MAG: hypothetical protein IBJ10_04715 [Phycisphaerales bacterium]|nr:hypothetical protein [Phycisphaerales bacterium]